MLEDLKKHRNKLAAGTIDYPLKNKLHGWLMRSGYTHKGRCIIMDGQRHYVANNKFIIENV